METNKTKEMSAQHTPEQASAGAWRAAQQIERERTTVNSTVGFTSRMAEIIDKQTATPELLGALIETRKALRSAMDRLESAGMRYIVAKPEYTDPLEQSRNAIAKAEGRA